MIRALALLVLLSATMVGAAWLAERPGSVTVFWQDWRVDTSVGVVVAIVALVAVMAALAYRLWRALVRAPFALARRRRERRRRLGYVALTRGLVAVAAGDPEEARRQARRADVLLNEPPLTMLLSAQAAQLGGEEDAARRHFTAMLARPETEFLGLRALLVQAMREGDRERALELARRARDLRPKTPWVLTTLFDLQTQAGDWGAALVSITRAQRLRVLSPSASRQREAAVLIELSRQAEADGKAKEALRLAERAHRSQADHPAAAIRLARLYAHAGKEGACVRLVERQWARSPHPELLAAYRLAHGSCEKMEWLKAVERLARLAPGHPDSSKAVGAAALEAGLWGEARRTLAGAASAGAPSAGLCRLMARLEAALDEDGPAYRQWLAKAAEAPPDAAWICESCGAAHADWQANCSRCGAFDRLAWRAPERVAQALAEGGEGAVIEAPRGPETGARS